MPYTNSSVLTKISVASPTNLGSIKIGDGLVSTSDGTTSVDFSQIPTNKFEELLKQLKVLIYLKSNLNMYVNISTGSDVLDENRGLSPNKPFRTIQACVDYICQTYNIYKYTLTINVATGTYGPLSLGSYTRTTGKIVIRANDPTTDDDFPVILECTNRNLVTYLTSEPYTLKNLKYKFNVTSDIGQHAYSIISGSQGTGTLIIDRFYFEFNVSGTFTNNKNINLIHKEYGTIVLYNTSSNIGKSYINIHGNENTNFNIIRLFVMMNNGTLKFSGALTDELAEIVCSGKCSIFMVAYNASIQIMPDVTYACPLWFSGNFVDCIKYKITNGGRIITDISGKGEDYFPCTKPGIIESKTYSFGKF